MVDPKHRLRYLIRDAGRMVDGYLTANQGV